MPLTASGQAYNEGGTKHPAFVRLMAGIETLILAGVLYLCSSVRSQEVSMAELKASATASQQVVAAIPALTIRVVQLEKDVGEHDRRISENTQDIKELRDRARLQ